MEDKINKLEVENTDLKNRMLNNDKQRLQSDRSNSLISPIQSRPSIDYRNKDDKSDNTISTTAIVGGGAVYKKTNDSKMDTLYSQYSSRYRSEKRQPVSNNNASSNNI